MTPPHLPPETGVGHAPNISPEDAVSNHTWVPAAWISSYAPVREGSRPRTVSFNYKSGDTHLRYVSPQGALGDWCGWNYGASGKQLWPLPPPSSIAGCLLIEGETSAIAAAYALHNYGWFVIASSGSSFPDDDPRHQKIRDWGVPVVAWRDNDDPGIKWEGLVRRWLEGHPVATFDYPRDARDWWMDHLRRYGAERGPETLRELVHMVWEERAHSEPPQPLIPEPQFAEPHPDEFSIEDALRSGMVPPLEKLLMDAGNKPGRPGGNWHCSSPSHRRGDRNPSLSVDLAKGVFHCFGCGKEGGRIGLAAETAGRGVKEYLREVFQSMRGLEHRRGRMMRRSDDFSVDTLPDWLDVGP